MILVDNVLKICGSWVCSSSFYIFSILIFKYSLFPNYWFKLKNKKNQNNNNEKQAREPINSVDIVMR